MCCAFWKLMTHGPVCLAGVGLLESTLAPICRCNVSFGLHQELRPWTQASLAQHSENMRDLVSRFMNLLRRRWWTGVSAGTEKCVHILRGSAMPTQSLQREMCCDKLTSRTTWRGCSTGPSQCNHTTSSHLHRKLLQQAKPQGSFHLSHSLWLWTLLSQALLGSPLQIPLT